MTYHTTKDLKAVYAHLEGVLAADYRKMLDQSFTRNTAAFFYGLQDSIPTMPAKLLRRYPAVLGGMEDMAKSGPEGQAKMVRMCAFAVVQDTIRRWGEAITIEEAIGGMQEQITDVLDAKEDAEEDGAEVCKALEGMTSENTAESMQQVVEGMLAPHPGHILGMPEFDEPKCNDMCYALWGATGDRRYIERVIRALDQPADLMSREGMVPITGAWSLDSLGQQYPSIRAITEGVPGAIARIKVLTEKQRQHFFHQP